MPKGKPEKGLIGGTTKVIPAPDRYVSWGDQAKDAKGEGWYPSQWDSEGTTVYRNSYNPGANTVQIPGEKNYGHLAAIGYKTGQFDIVIRDANGNVKQIIKKGVAPTDVRGYMTSPQSLIAGRVASIQAGTNQDRANADGSYAALYNPNLVK